jgi:hypothetical protein
MYGEHTRLHVILFVWIQQRTHPGTKITNVTSFEDVKLTQAVSLNRKFYTISTILNKKSYSSAFSTGKFVRATDKSKFFTCYTYDHGLQAVRMIDRFSV